MLVKDLIQFLEKMPKDADVQLQDINRLYWQLEERHILTSSYALHNAIVISTKNINEV